MLNKPTYLLVCLIEECAEIIQRACKAIRFGMDEVQPGQNLNNLDRISGEVDDFLGVAKMLEVEDCMVLHSDRIAIEKKVAKVNQFMGLSRDRGLLEPEEKNG